MDPSRVSAPGLACKQAASHDCVSFQGLLLGFASTVSEECHAIAAQDGLEAVITKGLATMQILQNQYLNSNYNFHCELETDAQQSLTCNMAANLAVICYQHQYNAELYMPMSSVLWQLYVMMPIAHFQRVLASICSGYSDTPYDVTVYTRPSTQSSRDNESATAIPFSNQTGTAQSSVLKAYLVLCQ